jgi:hypothetical protein
MIALMTTGLVLLPILAVSVVVAWAESRARHGEVTVAEPRLTRALLATRDDPGAPEQPAIGALEWTRECP